MIEVSEQTFVFENFELNCAKRSLLKEGEPVSLSSKSFDLLVTLIENRGRIVSKDTLLETVWEGQFVEENNLTVQISALRKIFGEKKDERRFIATVPGKGYTFIADVREPDASPNISIEKHEYAQIVIEDYVPMDATYTQPYQISSRSVSSLGSKLAILAVIVAASVVVVGSIYQWRSGLSDAKESFKRYQNVKQLTTTGNVGIAALSPDGKLFAYTTEDLGKKSLWLGHVNGGDPLQLREGTDAVYSSLTFSPDNKSLFYSLREGDDPAPSLMKMPAFGGAQEKILDDVGSFSLSPDGRDIAVARLTKDGGNMAVSIISLDGSPLRDVVTFENRQPVLAKTLSWSNDKKKLAGVVLRENTPFFTDIAVIDIASGTVDLIKNDLFREVTKTRWLTDGSGLLVTAVQADSQSSVPHYCIYRVGYPAAAIDRITNDRSQYGESWHSDAGVTLSIADESDSFISVEHRQVNNIWVAAAENLKDQRQITFGSFGKYDGLWGLDWTPDGELVFVTSDTESQFIARMKSDGSERKQITASGRVDSSLSVTGDGKHIVFHSNRGTDFGIWRTNIDGSNAVQLTSGGEAYQPTPSLDGKWVYYRSYIGENKGYLCRVPFEGGDEECVTDRGTSVPSFSPDGKYIAAIHRTDKSRATIFSAADHSIVRQIDMPKNASAFIGIRWKADNSGFTIRDRYQGYWMFPVVGEPYKLEGLPNERMYNFAWSRDGKWLAFVRGQEIRDVVMFSSAK